MKILLLLRHGKSSRKDASLADFDRPLKKRGKQEAESIGKEIRRQDRCPDLVISSAARRAHDTAELVSKAAGCGEPIITTEKLYMSGLRAHLQVLADVDEKHGSVLLVGHNPDLEDLVEQFTDRPVSLPTAALVCLELDADSWSQAHQSSGRLVSVTTPRDLTY